MNIWNDQVLPRLTERALDTGAIARLRQRTTAGLVGDVVEIGFGSGPNLPFLPNEVASVMAVEPSKVARSRARDRIGACGIRVEFVGVDGQRLPLADASLDAAVSTFTLCTISEPRLALAELLRVLKPGGEFHFLEHGLATDPKVVKWQHRLNPIQQRVAGGCHLDRVIVDLVRESGFEIVSAQTEALPGPAVLAPFGYLYHGVAAKP